MKVAIAQLNPRVGDVAHNLKKMLQSIEGAKKQKCSLLVFPELATLGYPPRDLLDFPHVIEENLEALAQVAQAAQGITVVCGYVERNSGARGKPFYNSAAVFRDGKLVSHYRKQLLPYYDVFEEERHFESGSERCIFEVEGKKVGLLICEDIWNEEGFIHREYSTKPTEALHGAGLDLLVNISASPFQLGKPAIRRNLFKKVAQDLKAPIIFCNQTGSNDELIFDGGSFLMDSSGVVAQANYFEEELLLVDLNLRAKPSSFKEPTGEAEWLFGALKLGIRDYVRKSGSKTVCLGLSGGIDSSVVAALAVSALGAASVSTLALPTRYNAKESLEDAEKLAKALGVSLKTISIDPIFASFSSLLNTSWQRTPKSLTLENIQPRIRMTLLMAFANEEGHLLLNTSNKSEIAVGYATQYGDTAGALAVLGDLTKAQVYELARYINRTEEIIPERVLKRAPTAELRENQTDQDSLPPYDVLDAMVKAQMEASVTPALLRSKYPVQEVDNFCRLNALSEYKRRQLPPALRVSSRAFGMGRRIPVVGRKPTQ